MEAAPADTIAVDLDPAVFSFARFKDTSPSEASSKYLRRLLEGPQDSRSVNTILDFVLKWPRCLLEVRSAMDQDKNKNIKRRKHRRQSAKKLQTRHDETPSQRRLRCKQRALRDSLLLTYRASRARAAIPLHDMERSGDVTDLE